MDVIKKEWSRLDSGCVVKGGEEEKKRARRKGELKEGKRNGYESCV
mgnify:CR=1 FL=1